MLKWRSIGNSERGKKNKNKNEVSEQAGETSEACHKNSKSRTLPNNAPPES